MENIKLFLENSTIHGLFHISNTRKNVRVFWIIAVIAGFTGAGVMIYQSFQSWNESPVKTTIETQSMEKFTFPNITICPPKNTYTLLNYDLKMIENMTLDNNTRKELIQYTTKFAYDNVFNELLTNMNKLQDVDRYYNWYHGYTKIDLPKTVCNEYHWEGWCYWGKQQYDINSYALSGSVLSPNDKGSQDIEFTVKIYIPCYMANNDNITLHIEKAPIITLNSSNGNNKIKWQNVSETHLTVSPPKFQIIHIQPGYNVSWKYTGNVKENANSYNIHCDKKTAEAVENPEDLQWKDGTHAFARKSFQLPLI